MLPPPRISRLQSVVFANWFTAAVLAHVFPFLHNARPSAESFRGNGLGSRRQERAMDRMDQPCTSIDEQVLSGRRAVMIV